MNTILVLASLVLVGTAWAEKPLEMDMDIVDITSTPAVVVDKKVLEALIAEARREGASLNVVVYEYDEKREVWGRARPAPCLETMQAAMEAADPYVLKGMTIQTDDPEFDRKVWEGWLIYKQWNDAKACWRKP